MDIHLTSLRSHVCPLVGSMILMLQRQCSTPSAISSPIMRTKHAAHNLVMRRAILASLLIFHF